MNKERVLSSEEQIKKLNFFDVISINASKSKDLISKIGAVTIFSGFIDFQAVQAARLLEQIILKNQLSQDKTPTFNPHEDSFFYDKKVNTRNILKVIKTHLPLSSINLSKEKIDEINNITKEFLKEVHEFLDKRNVLIHHIGNPKKDAQDFEKTTDELINKYHECRNSNRKFTEILAPFRFSQKEVDYFYKK